MSTLLPIKRAHLYPHPASDSFDLYIEAPDSYLPPGMSTAKRRAMVCALTPPVTSSFDEGMVSPIAATLTFDGAQALIDALWDAGLRPTKALTPKSYQPADSVNDQGGVITDLTRQLVEAKNQHIEDLRVIAQITKPRDRPATSGDPAEPLF